MHWSYCKDKVEVKKHGIPKCDYNLELPGLFNGTLCL